MSNGPGSTSGPDTTRAASISTVITTVPRTAPVMLLRPPTTSMVMVSRV